MHRGAVFPKRSFYFRIFLYCAYNRYDSDTSYKNFYSFVKSHRIITVLCPLLQLKDRNFRNKTIMNSFLFNKFIKIELPSKKENANTKYLINTA